MPESQSSSSESYRLYVAEQQERFNRAAIQIRKAMDLWLEDMEKAVARLAVRQAESKEQMLGDLESGRMCGGIDKAEGVDL